MRINYGNIGKELLEYLTPLEKFHVAVAEYGGADACAFFSYAYGSQFTEEMTHYLLWKIPEIMEDLTKRRNNAMSKVRKQGNREQGNQGDSGGHA